MAPDALGSVPFKPTEVVVKRKVPYFSLKVSWRTVYIYVYIPGSSNLSYKKTQNNHQSVMYEKTNH